MLCANFLETKNKMQKQKNIFARKKKKLLNVITEKKCS